MGRLVRQARQVAGTVLPVLIQGETGVGKELLARALHEWSGRRDEGLVTLNCAAIPDSLIESELFGHVSGAFTGAASARAGRFLTANGGTLFLDEIGEMPLPAQAKLLRVLQEGTFQPVGSDRSVKVDVRILAATNVDLETAVEEGRFRQDLFYRLDVFPLEIPPLRERPEDIAPIAAVVLDGHRPAHRARALDPAPRGQRRRSSATPCRATCASWSTRSSGPPCLAPPGPIAGRGPAGPARPPPPASRLRPAPRRRPAPGGAPCPLEEMERRYIGEVLRRTGGRIYGAGRRRRGSGPQADHPAEPAAQAGHRPPSAARRVTVSPARSRATLGVDRPGVCPGG